MAELDRGISFLDGGMPSRYAREACVVTADRLLLVILEWPVRRSCVQWLSVLIRHYPLVRIAVSNVWQDEEYLYHWTPIPKGAKVRLHNLNRQGHHAHQMICTADQV